VTVGDAISAPDSNPTKAGFVFVGWIRDSGTVWNFDEDVVTENTTLTALWVNPKDIVIQATATAANQILKVKGYFNNGYTVDC
jgi:uncharacterized repeat protein (TIGR02543 family)